ncbi:MAG: rhomboid family intramembrane serine protease [Akkermansiaceae bacterium]|nr:rhomboid family intramembrane serine protease [Akkermansiaceae bacterium]
MALADRDYYGEPEGRGNSPARLTPVVKALLIANIAIFILDQLVIGLGTDGFPHLWKQGAFRISSAIGDFKLWQLLTFQFLHADVLHILLNSVGLFIFGPWMERHFGSSKFIAFYLICGAGGALFYTLLGSLGITPTHVSIPTIGMFEMPLVGASAGIYGCIVGVAILAPSLKVQMIFPPVILTMRQLCVIILGIAVIVILFNLGNAGGQAGHLGGAIASFLLMRFVPWFGRGPKVGIQPPTMRRRYESKLSPRSELKVTEDSEVDAILDKISKQGFQSLTDEEKATLKKAAEEK